MTIFLLHQVDDYVVTTSTQAIESILLAKIQEVLIQPFKLLGLINMYNGLDQPLHKKYSDPDTSIKY